MEHPTQYFREPPCDCTVLVVDTDGTVVQGYAQSLRRAGYVVLEATSFDEAKRVWRATMPPVLVVDVRLGQYNGLQLLMRARTDRPDLKAIVTCPFADQVLEAETRRFGATFMIKPLAPWQIAAAVSTAVATVNQRVPNTPPILIERRRVDRRQGDGAFQGPERRNGQRRASKPPSDERRLEDRRKLIILGFAPERRLVNRRTPHA